MTVFAVENAYTHIIPCVGMYERCVLNAMIALSSISFGYQSPGLLDREISHQYKKRVMDEVYANLEKPCTIPRRLMYLWCHCCIILHGILTNTIHEGESQIRSIYQSLYEISLVRNQKQAPENENHDLFMYCLCFMFTIDVGLNNRACTSSIADPDFIESISKYEPEPRPYSSQWWILKIHVIISRIQFFAYNQNVPTREEFQSNSRYKAWKAILQDLTEYEQTLPQTLRPYSVTQKNPAFSFKNIHVTDESALLSNILYHSAFIWMYHLQPDLTLDQLQQVPPLSIPHAYAILGLLVNCEKPTLWMITFWTHKQACICLEEAEAREDAQELSREYEWVTGYSFDMHWEKIYARWRVVDEYKKRNNI